MMGAHRRAVAANANSASFGKNRNMAKSAKAYPVELEELSGDLSRMGGLVEDMLECAMRSVMSSDLDMARSVIKRDVDVDQLQNKVEDRVMQLLLRRHADEKDLRQTVAALKLAADLERIGDLAKNIAKRSLTSEMTEGVERVQDLSRMGRLVFGQLKRVLDAFSALDVNAAHLVWERDEEVDEHYNSLFRVLLTYMMEDPRKIGACTHLLFMAKNLERIGDHCTNIAETIQFLVTGEKTQVERPKADDLDSD